MQVEQELQLDEVQEQDVVEDGEEGLMSLTEG